jgi:hypothetical protein
MQFQYNEGRREQENLRNELEKVYGPLSSSFNILIKLHPTDEMINVVGKRKELFETLICNYPYMFSREFKDKLGENYSNSLLNAEVHSVLVPREAINIFLSDYNKKIEYYQE